MFKKIHNLVKQTKCQNKDKSQELKDSDQLQIEELILDQKVLLGEKIHNTNQIYYIENIINDKQSQIIQQNIDRYKDKWVTLNFAKRQLQRWGGEVQEQGLVNIEELPDFLKKIGQYLVQNKLFPLDTINTCLINQYDQGIGILPHKDGPLYFPYVCILSLNSNCLFKFYKNHLKASEDICETCILVEKNSLLIFKDDSYKEQLHCIPENHEDSIEITFEFIEEQIRIVSSSIDNLNQTSLYQKVRKMNFKQLNDQFLVKKVSDNIYSLIITQNRAQRQSLTFRYVKPSI